MELITQDKQSWLRHKLHIKVPYLGVISHQMCSVAISICGGAVPNFNSAVSICDSAENRKVALAPALKPVAVRDLEPR